MFCLVDFFPFNLIRSIWFESGTHKTKINQALILDLEFTVLKADIFELGKDGVNFRQIFITGFESTLKIYLKIGPVSEKDVIIQQL